jgi:hypothetical protein
MWVGANFISINESLISPLILFSLNLGIHGESGVVPKSKYS